MKKLLFLTSLPFYLLSCHYAQQKDWLSTISTLPSFDIQLTDSLTLLHTQNIPAGQPIVVLYFRPDCPHCQAETQRLIRQIGLLKDSRLYFLTGASLVDAKSYAHHFLLDRYPNITVGKDKDHFFLKTFRLSSIPCIAIYNREKRLVKIYHGEVPIDAVIATIQG